MNLISFSSKRFYLFLQESNADLPSEYWQIQKLVKYLKVRFWGFITVMRAASCTVVSQLAYTAQQRVLI